MILIVAGVFIALIWFYILFAREWLDAHLQGTRYAYWHEQIEDKLWDKSRTMLVGRATWLSGIIIGIQSLAIQAGIDWTPILTELGNLIPAKWRGLALAIIVTLIGLAITKLRKMRGDAQDKALE